MSFKSKFIKKQTEVSPKIFVLVSRAKEGKTEAVKGLIDALLMDTQEGVKKSSVNSMDRFGNVTVKDLYHYNIKSIDDLKTLQRELQLNPRERFTFGVIDTMTDLVPMIKDLALTRYLESTEDNNALEVKEMLNESKKAIKAELKHLEEDIIKKITLLKTLDNSDPNYSILTEDISLLQKEYKVLSESKFMSHKIQIVDNGKYGKIGKNIPAIFAEIQTLLTTVFQKIIYVSHAETRNNKDANSAIFNERDLEIHPLLKSTIIAQADAIGFGYRVGNKYIVDFGIASSGNNAYGTRFPHLNDQKVILNEMMDRGKEIFKSNWHIIYPDVYGLEVTNTFIEDNKECYTEIVLGTTKDNGKQEMG